MGNRSGTSRSKARENKYKYPDTYPPNSAIQKQVAGSTNPRSYPSQINGYSQHSAQQYHNGYVGHSTVANGPIQYVTNSTPQQYQQHNHSHHMNTNPKSNGNKIIYVANYDFNGSSTTGELSFVKGDKLEILDRYTYNDWWQAKNQRTKQMGYVPANYISPLNDLTAYEWYFTETNRRDAERFLEQPHNGKGTFLIRPSDTNQGQESLSVLDLSKDKHFHVKHYRIRRTNQGMYYISSKTLFPNLQELVDHYR
ncbi:unnamed protein product, partial [Adineta ricciae]